MKYLIAAACIAASPAAAQSVDANAGSQSSSGSYVYQEGSEMRDNTPGMITPGSYHTAPCHTSGGVALGYPGFGIGAGIPKKDHPCFDLFVGKWMAEAMMLPPRARRVAIAHLCATNERARKTLVAAGECRVVTK